MGKVNEAMQVVVRQDFLPPEAQAHASSDRPFPIGYGQTNSQPSTVRQMLEWLNVQPAQKVLDIGSGSGWTTALLSYLVGEKGKVYAIELVPELVDRGYDNCQKAGVSNAWFFQADVKHLGLPEHAPYDRILVSASAHHMPEELVAQLRSPGKLVIPVGHSICEVEKDPVGVVSITEHPGFVFVPLISHPG